MNTASILIVEDEAIVAADLECRLAALGYAVAGTTARGDDAIALARERRPDIVLMDIQLSGPTDGVAAAEIIRSEQDLPVIYLTAHSDPATLDRARLTEPFGYILKPFEDRELRTNIEMARYRHQLDRRLRESEERLRIAMDAAQQGAWETDLASGVVTASPRVAEIFGVPADHGWVTSDDWRHVVVEEDRPRLEQAVDDAARGEGTYRIEFRVRRPVDGALRWVRSEGLVRRDGPGRHARLIGVIRDITEQRNAADALRQLNAQLEQRVAEQTAEIRKSYDIAASERRRLYDVLETLPAYVVLLSQDYRVPFANRFFRERFGESHGRCCFDYLFQRTQPCDNCESFKPMTTRAPHHWEWLGPNGRHYDVHDFPFTDADGTAMILEMGIDVTEIRRAQAALQELNATLECRVAERTMELAATNRDLTRLNHAMVGREVRMIEMKKEVNALAVQLGQPPPYALEFEKNRE